MRVGVSVSVCVCVGVFVCGDLIVCMWDGGACKGVEVEGCGCLSLVPHPARYATQRDAP